MSPNLTSGMIHISVPKNALYETQDLSGKIAEFEKVKSNGIVDLTSLSSGSYFVKIESKDRIRAMKLIKN